MAVDDLDIVRVTAEMVFNNLSDHQNIYHVLKVSGGTIPDQTLMDDVAAQLEIMYTFMLPRQRTQLAYEQLTGQMVFGGADLMPDTAWPVLTAGTNGGDGLPLSDAGLVVGQTTKAKTQGRKYLGALSEVDNVDGVLQASLVTSLVNFAAGYIADFVIGANTYRFGTFNPISLVFSPFASALILGIMRNQRRRTQGFGS